MVWESKAHALSNLANPRYGAVNGARTRGILLGGQALYQLSYDCKQKEPSQRTLSRHLQRLSTPLLLIKHLFACGKFLFCFVQADAFLPAAIIGICALYAVIYPTAHGAFLKIIVLFKVMLPAQRANGFVIHRFLFPQPQVGVYNTLPHHRA